MIALGNRRNPSEVYRELRRLNPDAFVVKGFEDAYIGYSCGYSVIAAYDYDRCIGILMDEHGCDMDEAEDILNTDTIPQCYGENAPIFVRTQ